jgi:quercetin dioxygenase-like cupin family protein
MVTIRAGDIVHTPGGEWHWHGAAPDRFMTHLAVSEGDAEWGEAVSAAEYD